MLTYSKTRSLPEFKQAFGISKIDIEVLDNGKSFFKTPEGVDGAVSTKSLDALKARDIESVRVSWTVDDETGKERWMIHNTQSSTESTTLVSF